MEAEGSLETLATICEIIRSGLSGDSNRVCFLLGNSLASEFYMPTFRNTVCSTFIGG